MCDSQSQALIDDVLDEKITAQEMFTAFDISREVQRRGSKERHRNMKNYIHQAMKDKVEHGDYNSISVAIPNGQPPYAILYHHAFSDPSTYKPSNRGGTQPQQQVLAAPVTPALSALPDDEDDGDDTSQLDGLVADGKFRLDNRNRLLVPTRFLRNAGIHPGDTVVIFGGPDYVCISLNNIDPNPNTNNILTSKMVERNGDIRIAGGTLQSQLDGDSFVIDNEANRVIIRKG